MTSIIIFAVISAVLTLFLIAPISVTRKKTCYALMVLIPTISLASYVYLFPPAELLPRVNKEQVLSKQLAKSPDDIEIMAQLAALYISEDRLEKAIKLLEARANDNDNLKLQLSTAYFAKGLRYAENGQKEQALGDLQTASSIAPKDAPFLPDIDYFINKVKAMP